MPRFQITEGVFTHVSKTTTIEARDEEHALEKSQFIPDWEWTKTTISEEIITDYAIPC